MNKYCYEALLELISRVRELTCEKIIDFGDSYGYSILFMAFLLSVWMRPQDVTIDFGWFDRISIEDL